ncbi:MAG: Maf family protein [Nanobdellota archaeon]
MEIILASRSPRRKQIFEQLGIPFRVVPSTYEEDMTLKLSPTSLARRLAHGKAQEVATRENGTIIGVDTFIYKDQIIGKPTSKEHAAQILASIAGQEIKVCSGIAIIKGDTTITDSEVTRVKIAPMDRATIKRYINTGEPMDKAGAFAIQGKGAIFIEKITGCHHNVIGLPARKLAQMLQQIGIDIPGFWKN